MTYERSRFVEFSFLTLVDSELFLTHSPGYLNEALALVRPFHWIVSFFPYIPILESILCENTKHFLIGVASNFNNFTYRSTGIVSIHEL